MKLCLSFRLIALFQFVQLPCTLGSTVHYQLDLDIRKAAPDGFEREAIFTNGQFPTPLLTVHKNDRIQANVTNHLHSTGIVVPTSVHWHGMFQHRTATSDGSSFVSQCPIIPERYFVYNFSTAGQTGTFWYHSHYSTQYCDGLRGPLVIYDPRDPLAHLYDVDDASTVITLSDWQHLPAEAAFADKSTLAPTPDSVLINGKGRYHGGPESELSVITVKRGKRYRFRLVNLACQTYHNVSIDGHKMTIIEADGIEHRPHTVDTLTIFVGQRYSVVVHANQPIGNYWLRADPGPPVLNFDPTTDLTLNKAIFRYHGAPARDPKTQSKPGNVLVESDLIPLINPGPPGGHRKPDVHITMLGNIVGANWTINGASFFPPSVPVLLQILKGNRTPQSLLPKGSVYTLPRNSVIEIELATSISFPIEEAHPFHLHGHTFDIIQGPGQTVPNYVNPPRRDTLSSYNGNITFRFETNNPGPWLLHCHIDWHFSQGLAVVFAEDPAGIDSGPDSTIVPDPWKDLCPEYYSFIGTGSPA